MVKYIYDGTSDIGIIYKIDDSKDDKTGSTRTPWWEYRRCDAMPNISRNCYPQFYDTGGYAVISKEQANKMCKEWYKKLRRKVNC